MKLRDIYRKADLAIRLGMPEYASALCEQTLRVFPNDIHGRTLLGQAYLEQGRFDEACREFDAVLDLDPENVGAISSDGVAHSVAGQLEAAVAAFERAYELNPGNLQVRDSLARLYAQLDGEPLEPSPAPPVATVRWRLRHDDLDEALDSVNQILAKRPGDLLVLLARAEALWRAGRREAAEQACRQILTRHPRCLKPRLMLGQMLSADPARETAGVALLHAAFVDDPGAVVAGPLFRGNTFTPPALSDDLDPPLPDQILVGPDDLAAAFDTLPPSSVDEMDRDWRPPSEFLQLATSSAVDEPAEEKAAAVGPATGGANSPTEAECLLAVSCRGPLVARYGFEGFQRLERRLQTVARELAFHGTRLVVVFVDDPGSMSQHGLAPIWSSDPTEIKRAIDELDHAVGHDGGGVDAILIIGDDEIVPFYHLPNPADDDDSSVPSDSPYAVTPGGSIYTPEIPIGRLPDGSGDNPNLLLRQFDTLLELRRKPLCVDSGARLVQASRAALGAIGIGIPGMPAFGYTASSWEAVAEGAFAPIASAAVLRLCPPITGDTFNSHWIARRRFLHFSLHGAPNGSSWYGQCGEPTSDDQPLFPVAIAPSHLAEVDLAAPVVFAEASFGAQTASHNPTNSLALRFLSEGATAFVGSTAVTYGAQGGSLTGASLLGRLFWQSLRDGDPVGVALQRARRHYVRDALESQGYLDGDDQKVLLEFVVYGDPLVPVFQTDQDLEDEIDPALFAPSALMCNQTNPEIGGRSTSPALLRRAIQHLVNRCEEMSASAIRVHRRCFCTGQCGQPGHQSGGSEAPPERSSVVVATAKKEFTTGDGGQLVKVARATLSEDGELRKFVVSR